MSSSKWFLHFCWLILLCTYYCQDKYKWKDVTFLSLWTLLYRVDLTDLKGVEVGLVGCGPPASWPSLHSTSAGSLSGGNSSCSFHQVEMICILFTPVLMGFSRVCDCKKRNTFILYGNDNYSFKKCP